MAFKAKAYAKINLFLDITGKRSDGYHDLDTIMQSVSIYDEIALKLTDSGIKVSCNKEELAGEGNIVYKACKAFFELSGKEFGVDIKIIKNIPVAAGLGGGSADAAATLALLNKATNLNFSIQKLLPVAAKLGADVPFCLVGGTARAQGIGEVLTQVASPTIYYVLLKEREKQSTGHMYQVLDTTDYPKNGNICCLLEGLKNNDLTKISSNIFNAFEYCWDFDDMSSRLVEYNPQKVFLSGSGPTVCALFKNRTSAQSCAEQLYSKGYTAFFAETSAQGIEIV